MDIYKNYPVLQEDLQGVRQIMLDSITSIHGDVRNHIESVILGGGKMLRPAMVILGAHQGKRYDKKQVLAIAAAIELLHVATLIHDDVIDKAESRRGVNTLHTEKGNQVAIIAGDYLFSSSFQLVARYGKGDQGLYLSQGVRRICEAELSQNQTTGKLSITRREYLRRILGKTTLLFMLSLYTGGYTAKAPIGIQSTLRSVGYNVGMAFQIIDDILDITGNCQQVGKPVCNDLKQGVVTLPVIFAMQKTPTIKPLITEAWKNLNNETLWSQVYSEVQQGVPKAQDMAHAYTSRALQLVDSLRPSSHRDALKELVECLLIRKH